MIELERHIEILLLSNDCVIVPDFGGFMAHHLDARYDEADRMFLPPLRTLGFNPQLKINDSLLALSYVEAYDISYPEALRRISDEVEELKMHLENDGSYELNNIGLLTLNDDGNYVFTPCEAGILTPELYGLGAFEMNRIGQSAQQETEPESEEETARIVGIDTAAEAEEELDDDDVVRIKFSWIRNAAAIAAILLAVFILALPTGKTEMMTRTISNINNGLLFGMMSKDTNTSKIDIKRIDTIKASTPIDTVLKAQLQEKQDTVRADSVKTGYCIVLASYVTQRNAKTFVEMLQKKGYDSSEVYRHNDITRVIYGSYTTESQAYQALREIHKDKELAEAWVYHFK